VEEEVGDYFLCLKGILYVMRLLLGWRGGDVQITDEVVKAAAGNEEGEEEVMRLLLDWRGDDVVVC
jgi:hypothetical protein